MSNITVSAGEVCTIDRAQKLGIFDATNYFVSGKGYDTVTTYNQLKDENENRIASIRLCYDDTDAAYPLCIEEHGPGFVRKSGVPNVCKTYACPPGFERSGDYCKKEPMLKDARIDKRSRCDERWYDWFVTPNYHLGNRYSSSNDQCFTPCPPLHVPNFGTDPVDGATYGFFPKEETHKCVPRSLYFGGKYANGTDYCPLAWIFRMSATPEKVKQTINDKFDEVKKEYEGLTTAEFDKYRNADAINQDVRYVADSCGSLLDNVNMPSGAMAYACNNLNDSTKLTQAYSICQALVKDDKGEEALTLDADPARNEKKKAILKQACNAVFCNPSNNAIDVINKDSICFADPKPVDPETSGKNDDIAPAPTSEKEISFVKSAAQSFILVALIPFCIVILYFLVAKVIWPFIGYRWYDILGVFTKRYYPVERMELLAKSKKT